MSTEEKPVKPPTMKQRLDEIADTVATLRSESEHRATAKMPAKPYTEADALGRCAAALQELVDVEASARRSSYSNTFDNLSGRSVPRILRFLADRFGADLIERRTEPCGRRHLDDASSAELVETLRSPGRVL